MELYEGLITRRSIRKYQNIDVDDEKIKKIIKAGMYAPSAVNKQPWHFIVFKNQETKNKIAEVHPNGGMIKEAAAGILICYDENLQHDQGYGPIDCAAATQNMLLAAHDLGLGAVWIGIYPRQNRINAMKEIFNLPENIHAFSIVAIGYPAENKETPDRFKIDRIHYEKW